MRERIAFSRGLPTSDLLFALRWAAWVRARSSAGVRRIVSSSSRRTVECPTGRRTLRRVERSGSIQLYLARSAGTDGRGFQSGVMVVSQYAASMLWPEVGQKRR